MPLSSVENAAAPTASASLGDKRSATNEEAVNAKRSKASNVGGGDGSDVEKEAGGIDKVSSFRAWSKSIPPVSPTDIYRLKCTFGDPRTPLPSWIKTSKVDRLKDMLRIQKLPTDGSKSALLQRLQTMLPYVTFDIDSRECLQRVINSMVYYFGWDNVHLFSCAMPARGQLKEGVDDLWMEAFGLDMGLAVKMGNISADPDQHTPRIRKHIQKKLDNAKLTWADIARAEREPNAMGNVRKLSGAAFKHDEKGGFLSWDDLDEEGGASGGSFTLEELGLKKGDTIKLTYDFGDDNEFIIEVTDVVQQNNDNDANPKIRLLPEENLYGHETRAKLIEKSRAKMRKQYDDGSNAAI